MTPEHLPSHTALDLATGAMDPERAVSERRLGEMAGLFQADVDPASRELVYRVRTIPAPERANELLCATTVIEPGDVDGEPYMTAGHFHAVRDRAEVYVGFAGDGLVVLADARGRWRCEPLRSASAVYIPGGWAHRTVNTGAERLVFLSTWIADAGHDYEVIRTHGFPIAVMRRGGRAEPVPNPRYRAPDPTA